MERVRYHKDGQKLQVIGDSRLPSVYQSSGTSRDAGPACYPGPEMITPGGLLRSSFEAQPGANSARVA